jgi:hypothetical protein
MWCQAVLKRFLPPTIPQVNRVAQSAPARPTGQRAAPAPPPPIPPMRVAGRGAPVAALQPQRRAPPGTVPPIATRAAAPQPAWPRGDRRHGLVASTASRSVPVPVARTAPRTTTVSPKRLGPAPPPIQARRHPSAIQRQVKAYRVEYPPYKVEMDEKGKITGFKGNPDGKGINISFVKPDHSEYFAMERSESQQFMMRIVEFEISDDLWNAIQWKATGKDKSSVKQNWVTKVEKLKSPSWSDGKNLTTDVKKTALGFEDAWLDVLKAGVVGAGSVYYPGDDLSELSDGDEVWVWSDADGQPVGEGMPMGKGDAEEAGYSQMMTMQKAQRLGHYTPD